MRAGKLISQNDRRTHERTKNSDQSDIPADPDSRPRLVRALGQLRARATNRTRRDGARGNRRFERSGGEMKDILGQRFNRLLVIGRAPSDKRGELRWTCRCDCGNRTVVLSSHIRSGRSASCGCFRGELTAKRNRANAKHGHASNGKPTRTYFSWAGMHARCYRPDNKSFVRYGAKGIRVCKRWHSFENFLSDMGERPIGKTLHRINGNGDYDPSNCKWATLIEQQSNTIRNHFIEVDGISRTVAEWSRIRGFKPQRIHQRLHIGWTESEAVTL